MTSTIYGVVLNDARQRSALASTLNAAPYGKPPEAPVLFVKPMACLTGDGGRVIVPDDLEEIEAAATIALLFSGAPNVPTGAGLAIELSEPHESYYRPAIRHRCRDGFLPLGRCDGDPLHLADTEITLSVDGDVVHSWRLDRLVRGTIELIEDIAGFMTLSDGDILLVGLPGDAPRAKAGVTLSASAAGFSSLSVQLVKEPVR